MKTPSGKQSLCAGILGSKGRTERRLTDVLSAVSELSDYRKLLLEIQQMSQESRTSCPGLAAAVTDRAFDAEVSGRVLIKHALDSVNELRDEGIFYDTFGKVAQELSGGGVQAFLEKLRKEAASRSERFGDAAMNLLDESARAIEALGIEFSIQRDSLLVRRKNGPQGEDELRLATTQQLGQAGRVSSTEFFGGRKDLSFVTFPSLYTPVDCHHRPNRIIRETAVNMDIYAATIGGLGTTKSLLYQHARRVAELGPRGLRGEDPVTAILAGIAIVGAALTVDGLVTGNTGQVAYGAILVAGAGAVEFANYILVLAVIA